MMDYSMPLVNGIEATKAIRKYHSENLRIDNLDIKKSGNH